MITVVIPLYEGVTHLDFTGPHQFLSVLPDTDIVVASLDGAPITSHGLTFSALADLETIERCDLLCIPGGTGCVAAIENTRFLSAIRRLARGAQHLSSVCTGSLILAAAGLLAGRRAACHWAWRDLLSTFGAIPDDARVVRDGNIITGGGVTAGIDFALALIAQLRGAEAAQFIQLLLEYAPEPPFDAGLPETAPPRIREAVLNRMAATLTDAEQRIGHVARQLRA
ncbi:DJ-1/PfpI family protein [Pandoraea sp.]|uniref:DJ-1/PfpI family protein n=1 Tax=Pandoraea sp. TaxID=1883445 RepID=UPI00120000E3|nr:DJ-1/PfpI family protein [Pandoraea sp.]TAL52835.1 MAG: DJ-1/PfpI family protein [Pandoraea sp.]TAM19720.1 MAG: DJ-1/PfpI family protein [Pandoraea sp.]